MTKLWGGRFSKKTDPLVEEFTKSIHYDYKIAEYDLFGSSIQVLILGHSKHLTYEEGSKLLAGLMKIKKSLDDRTFIPDPTCEDIHTQIQKILESEVGDLVLKLQTARSRNDQVVFATKMYSKHQLTKLQTEITHLTKAIREVCEANANLFIPGFTHLQHAQPVYLKDYLFAYVEMLERDSQRLNYIDENLKIKIGSGALAGTPISAKLYSSAKELLDKNGPYELAKIAGDMHIEATSNSLDSVSDRDFVIEIISALSIVAMHLSRLAEDLIIWCTKEFDFIEIDDAYCTGSSLMPQKKNPDVLELIRGNTGRLYGNLVSVLTMMKGLPLTYNRDMQLDKEPLFNSFEIISQELTVLAGLIGTLKFNRDKIEEHLQDESLYATDCVYYLVGKGVPFKQAHTLMGEMVAYSLNNNILIKDIPEDVLKEKFSDKIVKSEFIKLFDPKTSVESKISIQR